MVILEKCKQISNKSLIKFTIVVTFLLLTILVSHYHEPWSDEAQAFLLARDSSFRDLFTTYSHYEGSPVLWHFILKIAISLGLSYELLPMVSIFFSTLGVYLLVYRTNLPWYLKLTLPFTYYIFYQYTIVARSYCLILPLLCLISIFYRKRMEKPFCYIVLLFLLANVSAHMALVSGGLFLLFCYDVLKAFLHHNATSKKQILFSIIAILLAGIGYLLLLFSILPSADNSFVPTQIPITFSRITKLIAEAIATNGQNEIINLFISVIFFIVLFITNKKEKGHLKQWLLLYLPLLCFLIFAYANYWHIGILFLIMIFLTTFYETKPRILYLFLLFAAIIQIGWTIQTCHYDITSPYSGAKEAANFIKEHHYDKKNIYGLEYDPTALQPYFSKNIYQNFKKDYGFYLWSKNAAQKTLTQIEQDLPDAFVLPRRYYSTYLKKTSMENYIDQYDFHSFKGGIYIKNKIVEDQSFIILTKK